MIKLTLDTSDLNLVLTALSGQAAVMSGLADRLAAEGQRQIMAAAKPAPAEPPAESDGATEEKTDVSEGT